MNPIEQLNSILSIPTYTLIPGVDTPIYPLIDGAVPIGVVLVVAAVIWMIDDWRKLDDEIHDVWVELNK